MLAIYQVLYSEKLKADARSLYELKLEIITKNLYGVDIDPFATNIAMLRLWLSLAVEADQPVPLPNLDFKIETGDSLLAPSPKGSPDLFRIRLQVAADALVILKRGYLHAHGDEKHQLREQIETMTSELREESEEQFGEEVVDWRIQFAEAFTGTDRGFDIVLANPPYIDSEQMSKTNKDLRTEIQRTYEFTKGNWDIYIAFFELAFRLLNPVGVIAFITPDKWISKPFGDALRVAKTSRLSCLLRLGRKVFVTAKVDAIVSIFSGRRSDDIVISEFEHEVVTEKRTVPKSTLDTPFAYDWLFSDYVEILAAIDSQTVLLSELGDCENACATSDAYKLKEYIEEEPSKSSRSEFLRIINTGTIGRYVSKWGKKKMTYLGKKILRPVVNKEDFLNAFTNSYGSKSIKPKIILKGLNLLDASLDLEGDVIPGKTTLVVFANKMDELKLLLCILNSRIAWFYLKEKYIASSYNQGTTFTKKMINELPLPRLSSATRKNLVRIADLIIEGKTNDDEFDSTELEQEVDGILFKEYSLSDSQIAAVLER